MSVGSVSSALTPYSVQSVSSPAAHAAPSAAPQVKSVMVAISAKAAKVAPSTITDAIAVYQAAAYAGTLDKLGSIEISDTSANLGSNFAVLAEMASKSKITAIKLTDKNASITTTTQALGNLADKANAATMLFQKLDSKLTVKIDNATAQAATSIKSPSKNVEIKYSINDTAAAVSSNIDALNLLAKSKGAIRSITLSSNADSLSLTVGQLKNSTATLSYISGQYSLNVLDASVKDVANLERNASVSSINIKDTLENILGKKDSLIEAGKKGKIFDIIITDKSSPTLSVGDAQVIASNFANMRFSSNVTYNIADFASNVISQARFDAYDIIKNAGSVTVIDKKVPNLTVADAKVLKSIKKLDVKTQYAVIDSKESLSEQASVSEDTILSGANSIVVAQAYTVAEYLSLSKAKSFDQRAAYLIQDTSKNITKQANIISDRIIKNAASVIVKDTSTSVVANISSLDSLVRKQRLTNIVITDESVPSLNLTSAQISSTKSVLGAIVTRYNVANGIGFSPSNAISSLRQWSAPATVPLGSGAYNFRTYSRNLLNGTILANVSMDTSQLKVPGERSAGLYLTVQDGLGNLGASIKVADMKTTLPQVGAPPNGGIFTINYRGVYGAGGDVSYNNQAIFWMDLQNDGTYSLLARTYVAAPNGIAANLNDSGVTFTSDTQVLVSGISKDLGNFTFTNINAPNNSNLSFVYETKDPNNSAKKNVYSASFGISSDYKTLQQLSSIAPTSGANAGAILVAQSIDMKSVGNVVANPNNGQAYLVYEGVQNGKSGLVFNELSSQTGLGANQRFLAIADASSNLKINALQFSGLTDPSVQTTTYPGVIIGVTGSSIDPTNNSVSNFTKFLKVNPWMQMYGSDQTLTSTVVTTINLEKSATGLWAHNVNFNTSIWSFQDGQDAHLVQIDGNGKMVSDDVVHLPPGAILDRVRNTNIGAPVINTNLFDLLWREPDPENPDANIIRHQLYDIRGNDPQYIVDNPYNQRSYLAGASGNDILQGRGSGMHVFAGGGGNDTILGGSSGQDIVSYTGNYTDYSIKLDAKDPTKIIVRDVRIGSPEGADTISGVGKLRFADKIVDTSTVVAS